MIKMESYWIVKAMYVLKDRKVLLFILEYPEKTCDTW